MQNLLNDPHKHTKNKIIFEVRLKNKTGHNNTILTV